MLVWMFELIIWLVVMRFIEEIGFWGTCGVCVLLHVFSAAVTTVTLSTLFNALVSGFVAGIMVYLFAKIGLFLIRVLGSLGSILIGLVFILALLAIIF